MLIVLTRPEGFVKSCGKKDKIVAKIIKSKYPKIAYEVLNRYKKYNESVKMCEKLEKDGKAIVLRPETSMSSYEKDTKVLRNYYEQGYRLAKARMKEIKELM